MCTISNKLKLCSCKTKDVYTLKNFWVLHRFVRGKDEYILGETMMPCVNPLVDDELNERNLSALLNDGQVFDFDIQLKNKDLLQLAFKFNGDKEQHNNYGFEFKNGKWKTVEYDLFGWMYHHEEFKYGKVKQAIKTI